LFDLGSREVSQKTGFEFGLHYKITGLSVGIGHTGAPVAGGKML